MQWYKNRKTATKLMLAFGCMAVLIVFVGYQGITGMRTVDGMLEEMYHTHTLGLAHLKEANIQLIMISRAVRNAILDDNEADVQKRIDDVRKYRQAFLAEIGEYQKRIVREANRARCAEIVTAFHELGREQDRILEYARTAREKEAKAGLKAIREMADRIDHQLDALSESKLELLNKAAAEAQSAYESKRAFVLIVIAVAIALAASLGIFVARLVAAPLRRTVEVLESVAGGDLTRSLDLHTQDEVGQMAAALNQAVDAMRSALLEVRSSADSVASSSQQLASASEELSSGAQEQSASLEETAASLEEIASTVKQNADSARQANQLAAGSREAAEKGGNVVSAAVAAMGEINTSSKKIADIITAIDEIAFQTNLLALNAAVEAARAGEQGRGFAVVAAEVRNLAQRSATAAKEIKGLIQDSVRKVENGSEMVNRSGQTLQEIVTSVKRVTDIVAEIAAASQEQSGGIDQVSKAMAQMDNVTQANAGQTEELSSTAQLLSSQAEQLQALVGRFVLECGSRRPAPSSAPAVKPAPSRTRPAGPAVKAAPAKARQSSPSPAPKPAPSPAAADGSLAALAGKTASGGNFEEF